MYTRLTNPHCEQGYQHDILALPNWMTFMVQNTYLSDSEERRRQEDAGGMSRDISGGCHATEL